MLSSVEIGNCKRSCLSGGEKELLNYVQDSPAEHVELKDVLNALGISAQGTGSE
jgi:hypothetical protein